MRREAPVISCSQQECGIGVIAAPLQLGAANEEAKP